MNIDVQMNPGFKEVDRSRKRYIVMKGSAGSGKKSSMCSKGGRDQQG